MEKSVQFYRLFLFVCATYQSSNLTIKGTDKSFNLSNVVRPTERAKPESNLIIAPSLLTDLDRRSQLRNENRSFEERGKLARAPNPFFRFDLNHGETRRAVRKETRDRAWYRDGRRGIGGFIEHRNQYIRIYIRVVSEVANAIGSLIDRGCIPRIIPAACPPLFRSFYRLSSKLLETFAGFFERYRR